MNYPFSHPYLLRAEKPDLRAVKGVKAVKVLLENSSHYRRAARVRILLAKGKL